MYDDDYQLSATLFLRVMVGGEMHIIVLSKWRNGHDKNNLHIQMTTEERTEGEEGMKRLGK